MGLYRSWSLPLREESDPELFLTFEDGDLKQNVSLYFFFFLNLLAVLQKLCLENPDCVSVLWLCLTLISDLLGKSILKYFSFHLNTFSDGIAYRRERVFFQLENRYIFSKETVAPSRMLLLGTPVSDMQLFLLQVPVQPAAHPGHGGDQLLTLQSEVR